VFLGLSLSGVGAIKALNYMTWARWAILPRAVVYMVGAGLYAAGTSCISFLES
jgi:hypothetical protein